MENLKYFLLFLLSLINVKIKGTNDFFKDYMSLENTSNIRGIFVWMILIRHYRSYYKTKKSYICNKILNYLGQRMVSPFLFYSGYGIMESLKKKGNNYIIQLPRKSLILFIKFQIIKFIHSIGHVFLHYIF